MLVKGEHVAAFLMLFPVADKNWDVEKWIQKLPVTILSYIVLKQPKSSENMEHVWILAIIPGMAMRVEVALGREVGQMFSKVDEQGLVTYLPYDYKYLVIRESLSGWGTQKALSAISETNIEAVRTVIGLSLPDAGDRNLKEKAEDLLDLFVGAIGHTP